MSNTQTLETGIKSGVEITKENLQTLLAYRTAEIVHTFFQCVDDILKEQPSYQKMNFDFRIIENNPELIRANMHSMTLMLLDPITREHAKKTFKKREKLSMEPNKALLPSALDWLQAYLSNLPELKKPEGSMPLAVIRKMGGKKYLSLNVGKETPEGKHYSRVFFGDTLEPVWMEIDPKTGDIMDDTIHTFGN